MVVNADLAATEAGEVLLAMLVQAPSRLYAS